MTIRLLLADDQELVRQALCALLALEDDFEVVASVGRGDEPWPPRGAPLGADVGGRRLRAAHLEPPG
ncbi:DNA-binding response regulator, partial [Amycolatopsis sp. NPDC005961]